MMNSSWPADRDASAVMLCNRLTDGEKQKTRRNERYSHTGDDWKSERADRKMFLRSICGAPVRWATLAECHTTIDRFRSRPLPRVALCCARGHSAARDGRPACLRPPIELFEAGLRASEWLLPKRLARPNRLGNSKPSWPPESATTTTTTETTCSRSARRSQHKRQF